MSVIDNYITNSILKELNDIHAGLTKKKFKKIIRYYKNKKVTYTAVFLSSDIYKSIVNSGKLLLFPIHIQHDMKMIYERINKHTETHNDYLYLGDLARLQNFNWTDDLEHNVDYLQTLETDLKKRIPKLIKKLDKQVK